ncbi:hypothetical protein G9A89_017638 [Geosiphon pyriformis]|nr:hypothetical protein G9A89_017638 [Geosiphon pyriformis]
MVYFSILGATKAIWWREEEGIGWIIPQLLTLSQTFLIPFFVYHSLSLTYNVFNNQQSPENLEKLPAFLNAYQTFLGWCAPLFILAEGFATVLFISGTRKIIQAKSNLQIYFLIVSILGLLCASYFLVQVYNRPGIDKFSATLIGSSITLAIFLQVIQFSTGKGLITEAVAMFAYVVYCVHLISSEWGDQPTSPDYSKEKLFAQNYPLPLLLSLNISPGVIIEYIQKIFHSFGFIAAIKRALSLEVFISFTYRLIIISLATDLVIRLREKGYSSHVRSREKEKPQRYLAIITSLFPPLVIAVYTHILLCHYGYLTGSNDIWQWFNVYFSLSFYAFDLIVREDD